MFILQEISTPTQKLLFQFQCFVKQMLNTFDYQKNIHESNTIWWKVWSTEEKKACSYIIWRNAISSTVFWRDAISSTVCMCMCMCINGLPGDVCAPAFILSSPESKLSDLRQIQINNCTQMHVCISVFLLLFRYLTVCIPDDSANRKYRWKVFFYWVF